MALPPLLDRGRGRGLALVAALTLAQGLAAGAAAFATRGLFEAMHRGAAPPAALLAVVVGAGAVIAAARVAARQAGERIGQDYAKQIRTALFAHAALMPAREVANRRAGYMSLRFVGDMAAFRNWIGLGLPRLVAAAVLLPAMLAVLWLLDPAFLGAALPVVAAAAALSLAGGGELRPLHRKLRARRARIAAEMSERMPLAPHLDRLGRRETEIAQLEKRGGKMIAAALRLRLAAETLRALPDLAAGVAAALVMLAGYRAGAGTGAIAGALAATALTMTPLRDLGGVWNHRAAFRAAAAKAETALSRAERGMYLGAKKLPVGPIEAVFENVGLPSGAAMDIRVAPGARVALPVDDLDFAAATDLLLGLDSPVSGRVVLSGVDLRDLSRGSLRRGVARIGPTPAILQGSLRRALTLGRSRRPDDDALEAMAREEGLGPAIERLGGLAGTVREGGRNLSRSERIAVSLVRARLLRARLLLLDPGLDRATLDRVDAYLKKRKATVLSSGGRP